jgi:hypothetical protein
MRWPNGCVVGAGVGKGVVEPMLGVGLTMLGAGPTMLGAGPTMLLAPLEAVPKSPPGGVVPIMLGVVPTIPGVVAVIPGVEPLIPLFIGGRALFGTALVAPGSVLDV